MFKPGQSGNPAGRRKGSKNKISEKLRKKISDFLLKKFKDVETDFDSMKPALKTKLFVELLPFVIPKHQTNESNISIENLNEAELDKVITSLVEKNEANK